MQENRKYRYLESVQIRKSNAKANKNVCGKICNHEYFWKLKGD